MKKYFVVSFEIAFGFGGFARRAFPSLEMANEFIANTDKKRFTGCKIYSVQAPNAKAAIAAGPSMFGGAFRGIDIQKI